MSILLETTFAGIESEINLIVSVLSLMWSVSTRHHTSLDASHT